MKFEIYQDVDEEWRFRLVARNGEVVAVSESYTRKESAEKTCSRIIEEIKSDGAEIKEIEND